MILPFTFEQFLSVFASYNESVFPMQVVLNVLAVASIIVLLANKRSSGKVVALFLAFLWLWTGLVYQILFFTVINKAAYVFGSLFIIQSLLFLLHGTVKGKLQFRYRNDLYGITGLVFILYALLLYPVLGYFSGHIYPNAPTFGAPCPAVIFTFGILLMTANRIPWYMLVIPVLWSIIGLSAAINLHITEDLGLLAAGIIGTVLILIKGKRAVKENARKGEILQSVEKWLRDLQHS